MYRIIEAVRQADLTSLLDDIRSWLDFDRIEMAEAFTEAFQGSAIFPALISEPHHPIAHSEAGPSDSRSFSASGAPRACQTETGFSLQEYAWSDFAYC
jgi:hypothetical protein